MKKGQYLEEVSLGNGKSLKTLVEEAFINCKLNNNNVKEIEVHQIVCMSPDEFLIIINFYN
ncbi:hypothetical protein [Lysinibacillus sp. NPDC093216]|uniref:hypothetical protein n=1 Tax=Lysinibacillus sp. NPDC093216 TaxID=3390576 RepID=UPI003D08AA4F